MPFPIPHIETPFRPRVRGLQSPIRWFLYKVSQKQAKAAQKKDEKKKKKKNTGSDARSICSVKKVIFCCQDDVRRLPFGLQAEPSGVNKVQSDICCHCTVWYRSLANDLDHLIEIKTVVCRSHGRATWCELKCPSQQKCRDS